VKADVLDAESLRGVFRGAEVVYHLAACISVGWEHRDLVRATNVQGTRHVVDACLEYGVRRLVHFSSIHATAPRPAEETIEESRPFASGPGTPLYDSTKAEGERVVLEGVSRGLDAVIVNPTAVLGPFDFKPSAMGKVLLDLVHRRLPALVSGGFDWVDVRDVSRGAIAAERVGRTGERYLLSGTWTTLADLARLVERASGVRAPRWTVPAGVAEIGAGLVALAARALGRKPFVTAEAVRVLQHHRNVSCERARRELGYAPRPLEATIRDTLEWFERAGMLSSRGATP
jgi:dihydroflavonol-4-reductase